MHDRLASESGHETHRVSRIYVHPLYSTLSRQHDLALLKISTPIGINNKNIVPVCLNTEMDNLVYMTIYAVGWGAHKTGLKSVSRKHEVTQSVLTDSTCKITYGRFYNGTQQFCAGRKGENRDTCTGDSGGPIHLQKVADMRWYQVGLTSFGMTNCGDGGVYSRINAYTEWIQSIVGSK